MSFKVVLINETQEVEPVPHSWEENGVVYWPPDKISLRKLQSNAQSEPDKSTWISYTCIVKAENILFYGDASAEADYYIGNPTDTETISNVKIDPTKRRPQKKNIYSNTGKLVNPGQFQHLIIKNKNETNNSGHTGTFSISFV